MEELEGLNEKIGELEKKLHGYKVGAITFSVAISIFLYFQWTQIPKKAEEALTAELTTEVRDKIKDAASQSEIILKAGHLINGRIRAGTTGYGTTKWKVHDSNTVKVHVDTTLFGFKKEPIYVISLAGSTEHYRAIGTASIYNPSKDGFDVFVNKSGVSPQDANDKKWRINWISVEL